MREEEQPYNVRNELLERLRALEGPQSSGTLAELSYRRAREALERALEEARTIRLQAIEDARSTRERELTSLMDSMRSLRESAERQIQELFETAEIEVSRLSGRAKADAQAIIERATAEAAETKAEAAAIRTGAEERVRTVERIEADFNRALSEIAERIGLTDKPSEGWWKRFTDRT
ncbi:MAG: hypothetical protein GEU75_08605 [Dehalococcoidia bacterium]|nr:hypothetical protein [Dehalococcoidia bacterium]